VTDTRFPNYLGMPTRVPLSVWHAVRFVSIAALVAMIGAAVLVPADALTVFWGILVPVLPLVFLVVPGSWRNVCPLAALNQASRNLGVSRAATAPPWLAEYGFVLASGVFVAIVIGRKIWFNDSGPALAVLLTAVAVGAALGGWLLKGKSGWCSSICPLLPVQRLYGQTPFVGVPNSHCRPCVGCTKNCYDFNPRVAYVADMHDPDESFRGYRRFFVAGFPGLVQGFFVVPDVGAIGVGEMVGRVGIWVAASIAVFVLLDTYAKLPANWLPVMAGAAAFSLFYFHTARRLPAAIHSLVGGDWTWLTWPLRVVTVALALIWVVRSFRVEHDFLAEVDPAQPVRIDLGRARAALDGDTVEVAFGGVVVAVADGTTLLDAAETAGVAIEAGCRQGVCGADPVAVLDGFARLSAVTAAEADTLARLDLGGTNRMACMARVHGACSVSPRPDPAQRPVPSAPTFRADPSVERVVVIGNGVAGVTTADYLRRAHETVSIDIIGAEPHHLYNRMGISRVVVGRSAMQGLYLLPERWHEERAITPWLNTRVTEIDRAAKVVRLGVRDELPYDRLVLAMGGRATIPSIGGFGMPGSFVLREAADAVALRAGLQGVRHPHVIIAGGGLLGLEAGHALHELGVDVTIAERSTRMLSRALDEPASALLRSYFESIGIAVRTEIELAAVDGDDRVRNSITRAGESLACDAVVVAAGMTPNTELATSAGLDVGRGVRVDDRMRTSDPDIFAVGDVAEFGARTWGLWPVAVTQAGVAATVIAGGDATYVDVVPKTTLKGCGLDVVSFGAIEADEGDVAIVDEDRLRHRYRKVVLRAGIVVGGVFLGHADEAVAAEQAADDGRRFDSADVARMRAGDWTPVLAPAVTAG
jgi:nitrite reductase (NADH) large subunit